LSVDDLVFSKIGNHPKNHSQSDKHDDGIFFDELFILEEEEKNCL
jgi:hypothetical protein